MKELTIVIPHYNDKGNLINLLSSIEKQNFNLLYEVIVLDDGSIEPLVIPSFNFRIRILENERNRGTGYTRNRLIQSVQTRYALSIDSDCLLEGNNIVESLWCLRDKAQIIFPTVELESGERVHPRTEFEENYIRMSTCFLIDINAVKDSKVKFRDYFIFFYEDEDFFIQCQRSGLTSFYAREVSVTHVRSVSGKGERKFGHYEWYALFRVSFLMLALHGSKYFKSRKLFDKQELYEIVFHPSYCPGRTSAYFRAIITFFFVWPRAIVLNTLSRIF